MKTPPLEICGGARAAAGTWCKFPFKRVKGRQRTGRGRLWESAMQPVLRRQVSQAQPLLHLAAGLPLTHACSRACSLPEISMQHPDAVLGLCVIFTYVAKAAMRYMLPLLSISLQMYPTILFSFKSSQRCASLQESRLGG